MKSKTVNVQAAVGRVYKSLSRDFSVPQAFAELILNGMDAGATTISCWFDNKKRVVIFTDNGSGINGLEGLQKYVTAGLSTHMGEKDRKAIGINGTGKTACFALGNWYTLRTKTKHDAQVYEISLSEAELNEHLLDPSFEIDVKIGSVGSNDPDTDSFTVVTIWDLKEPFALEDLLREIPRHLPFDHGCVILVNDQVLQPIKLEGAIIEVSVDLPKLGKMEAKVVVPDSIPDVGTELMFRAGRDVMSVKAFFHELRGDRKRMFPLALLDSMLMGYIDIPSLNREEYVVHGRNSFAVNLFRQNPMDLTTDLGIVLEALRVHVGPKVSAALGSVKEELEEAEDRKLLEQLRDLFDPVQELLEEDDDDVKPPPGPLTVSISPKSVEIEPGETVEFRVSKKVIDSPSWNAQGGRVRPSTKNPHRVVYTAGQRTGQYIVKVSGLRDGNFIEETADVSIVDERHFRISPSRVTIAPGEAVEFRIRNKSPKSGSIIWSAYKIGGSLDAIEGDMVIYTAGPSEGQFEFVAHDSRPTSGLSATARIIIRRSKVRREDPGDKILMQVQDLQFEVELTTPNNRSVLFSWAETNLDNRYTLRFNKTHPSWRVLQSRVRRLDYLQHKTHLAYLWVKGIINDDTLETLGILGKSLSEHYLRQT